MRPDSIQNNSIGTVRRFFRDVSAVLAVDQQILLAVDLSQKFRITPSTGAILEP